MSSYSDNNQQNTASMNDEIDLKEIFAIILRYKKSIIFITFMAVMISSAYAYFQVTVYQANLILQIDEKKQSSDDFMAQAMGVQSDSLGNEITILRSRFIAQKVLEKINLGTQYFVSKNFKTVELYKRSPFSVQAESVNPSLDGYSFHLTPVKENSFKLTIDPTFKMKASYAIRSALGQEIEANALIHFSEVFSFGKKIITPLFSITVTKKENLDNKDYSFTIVPNEYMSGVIQSSLGIGTGKEKSSILYISYRDNIPQRAEEILNILVEVFAEQSIEEKSSGAKKRLGFIEDQLIEINNVLQNAGSNLKDYKSSHTMIDLESKASMAAGKLDDLKTQLYELNMQQSVLKYLLDYLENNEEVVGIDVGSGTALSEPISSLIGKIQDANSMYASMQADYTEKHPSVIKIVQELASLKASLRGTIESSLRGTNQRKLALTKEINKSKSSLKEFPQQEQDMTELTRSFSVNEQVYEYLLQKRVETAIVESSTDSGMRVIDDAQNSGVVKPNRVIIVLIGSLIGLILGILQAFARNFLANTIQSIADIEKNTFLPIYTVLPFFKDKKSLYEDTLRVLLTKLEFREQKSQVVTVTSSVKGEGRTTTAVEFAKVIAQSSRKVVVLDFDLRSSKVHEKLNISNTSGISTLLSGESTLQEATQNIDVNLDIIVAGPVPSNPYGLIMSDALETVMTQLREKYDYIIIESPAAGLVADALILMRLADISLIVFKAKYSKKSFLKNTNRFVQEHRLENVGIVLNGLDLKKIRPWIKK